MRNLMNNSLRMLLSAFLLMILLSCQDKAKEEKQYSFTTQKLVDLVKSDERIKLLLTEAIEKGKKINPDSSTNPAQSLEEYYNFIDHSQTAVGCHFLSRAAQYLRANVSGSVLLLFHQLHAAGGVGRRNAVYEFCAIRGTLPQLAGRLLQVVGKLPLVTGILEQGIRGTDDAARRTRHDQWMV